MIFYDNLKMVLCLLLKRSLFVAASFMLLSVQCGAVTSDKQISDNTVRTFYLDPSVGKVNKMFNAMSSSRSIAQSQAMAWAGMISEVFKRYPVHVDDWIQAQYSTALRSSMACALWNIGDNKKAQLIMQQDKWSQDQMSVGKRACQNLFQTPATIPDQLDALWSAFFMSGNTDYVRSVLKTLEFDVAQVGSASDIEYAAYTMLDHGQVSKPLAAKYAHDIKKFEPFSMGVAALWALVSNARQGDKLVNQVLEEYVKSGSDPNVGRIIRALMESTKCKKTASIDGDAGTTQAMMFTVNGKSDAKLKRKFEPEKLKGYIQNTFNASEEVVLEIMVKQPRENADDSLHIELFKDGSLITREPACEKALESKGAKLEIFMCGMKPNPQYLKTKGLYLAQLSVKRGSHTEDACTSFYVY